MSEYAITLTSCPPLEEVVRALGGELTTPESRALTAHLQQCPVCRASIGEVEGALTIVAIARARDVASSLDLSPDSAAARKQRFLRRLDEVEQEESRRSAMRLSLAAAMITLIVAGFVFRTQSVLSASDLVNVLMRVVESIMRTFAIIR
jgi:hypothetical protein